jgi:dephospho-CoA kinase
LINTKPTIGLTGGIASGKSAVARVLRELGIPVIDADQIAREVVAPGSEGLAAVVAAFGPDVLTPDGQLDRERMGQRVFTNPEARKQLQAITHPRIGQLSGQRLAEARAGSAPYVVYEAPLLVEVGAHKGMDALIVVAAAEDTQVARATTRDGLRAEEVRQRIAAQLPLSSKVAVADYVIANDGTLQQLQQAAHDVHARIVARFASGTPGTEGRA